MQRRTWRVNGGTTVMSALIAPYEESTEPVSYFVRSTLNGSALVCDLRKGDTLLTVKSSAGAPRRRPDRALRR